MFLKHFGIVNIFKSINNSENDLVIFTKQVLNFEGPKINIFKTKKWGNLKKILKSTNQTFCKDFRI